MRISEKGWTRMIIAEREADLEKEVCREIIRLLLEGRRIEEAKRLVCSRYGLKFVPSNVKIMSYASSSEKEKLVHVLRKKSSRSLSGILVVAVMTPPLPCPGECIYCPGGVSSPKSYTGHEPATLRATENYYDPFLQVKSRLEQFKRMGHKVEGGKVKLVIMGGTFLASSEAFQDFFVKRCLDAITGVTSSSLDEAKELAEKSKIRNVGITIETRPDYCKEHHVDRMLQLGATKVELGVQTVYDEIYSLIRRGHSVDDVVEAFRVAKDAGLKVTAHIMPNLPGSTPERDIEIFRTIFYDPRFKPDSLKIYPCLVLEGTKLYDMYKRGEYEPYPLENVVEVIAQAKKMIPYWVRIQRIQRDIPARLIVAGVKKSNLRELVLKKLESEGSNCRCIRCREIGRYMRKGGTPPSPDEIKLHVEKYNASEGEDYFISYETEDRRALVGFIRMRAPSEKAHRPEVSEKCSVIIRELRVYGPLVPVGEHLEDAWQHKGYGERLLADAERIAREECDAKKILVLSGLGVKEYYYKYGYEKDGVYVSKGL
ncbi:MAG: tRNA uridine(34) 5-carboxymethylaminomethyl modification radical SAM/GNAT enzyme Elp3 [Candidatus Jordarchaeales archaeon]